MELIPWGLRFSDIINKASKLLGTKIEETQTAQPRGKLTAICSLMSFPHPLQNRVPRVRILLPLPNWAVRPEDEAGPPSLELVNGLEPLTC